MFVLVIHFLEKVGFLLKIEKWSVNPCQRMVFLGGHLDSSTRTLCRPQSKLDSIVSTCLLLLAQKRGSLRTLSTLIGCMSHTSEIGIMLAPRLYRGLQRLLLYAVSHYGHGRDVVIPLSHESLDDLEWWVSQSVHLNGCPIRHPPIDATIWSNAGNIY